MVKRQTIQNKLYKNIVIIGVLFLLAGTSIVSPVIGGKTLDDISVFFQEKENRSLDPNMIKMECHVCKPNNMTAITQMVPFAVAQNLSRQIHSLMNAGVHIEEGQEDIMANSLIDDIVEEIKNIGLLPDGMTIEDIKELIASKKLFDDIIPGEVQLNTNSSWNAFCIMMSAGFNSSVSVSKGGVFAPLVAIIVEKMSQCIIDWVADNYELSDEAKDALYLFTVILVIIGGIIYRRFLPRFMARSVQSNVGHGKVITSGVNGFQGMEHQFSVTAFGFCGLILTSYFPNVFSMALGSSLYVSLEKNT